ncbi:MAG TPA: PEP-CTERM sorting domain-containing protein [Vicinamibacterales bacterium]|nr:PEP-CTERM sorting domain-containing protein [Vicinamibacterales bacterium]
MLEDVTGNFPTLAHFAHTAPVPEPGSLFLAGGGLVWCVRRLTKKRSNDRHSLITNS